MDGLGQTNFPTLYTKTVVWFMLEKSINGGDRNGRVTDVYRYSKAKDIAKQLRLSKLSEKTFDFLAEQISNEDFLAGCFQEEIEYREEKAKARRIKQPQLTSYKGFETFDTEFQKGITCWKLNQHSH